jgi:hypothetical protein
VKTREIKMDKKRGEDKTCNNECFGKFRIKIKIQKLLPMLLSYIFPNKGIIDNKDCRKKAYSRLRIKNRKKMRAISQIIWKECQFYPLKSIFEKNDKKVENHYW